MSRTPRIVTHDPKDAPVEMTHKEHLDRAMSQYEQLFLKFEKYRCFVGILMKNRPLDPADWDRTIAAARNMGIDV